MKKNKGITLIALIVTIIILLILAGSVLILTLGDSGIIAKAKEAKKKQILANAKEKIGIELLTAQAEAIEKDRILDQEQIENIISKYGELQEDGDTIDNGYKISLLEIYTGTTITEKSTAEYEAEIALLEKQIETLKKQLKDAEATENNKILYYVSGAIYSRKRFIDGWFNRNARYRNSIFSCSRRKVYCYNFIKQNYFRE